jgi:hypothetical protein
MPRAPPVTIAMRPANFPMLLPASLRVGAYYSPAAWSMFEPLSHTSTLGDMAPSGYVN